MTNAQIEIRDVFAEVTRYPVDVLDLNANLEEDLGIDSVKLGDVLFGIDNRGKLDRRRSESPDALQSQVTCVNLVYFAPKLVQVSRLSA